MSEYKGSDESQGQAQTIVENWLSEQENFHLRIERYFDDMRSIGVAPEDIDTVTKWIKGAVSYAIDKEFP